MTTKQIKKIPLVDLLGTIGHLPDHTRKNGNEYWYFSPLRKEKTPSFKVTIDKNSWYDFGGSNGGSIIDFVMKYNNVNTTDAIRLITSNEIRPININVSEIPSYSGKHLEELRSVKQIGNNPALTEYLKERGINIEFAKRYIKEVYYRRGEKNFFTLGMRNDSNGYEVRTKFFKGCILNKNISTITMGNNTVSVFEGFIDFLSLLTIQKIGKLKSDVVILHSTSCTDKATEKINVNDYNKVFSFFDNDEAGTKAFVKMKSKLNAEVKDMRYLYEGFEDLNDKLLCRKQH